MRISMSEPRDLKLTQDIVRKLLDYDPVTGKLVWKSRGRQWFAKSREWNCWNTRYAGKEITSKRINKKGYGHIRLRIYQKSYFAHRVIWLWMTGDWPKGEIDHIDRDGTNNKWSNLRDVDSTGNNKNLSMSLRNTSGVTGVSWSNRTSKWMAQVTIRGKTHTLGFFAEEDLDLAAMEVMEFRAENGFSPTHGIQHAHYHQKKENH